MQRNSINTILDIFSQTPSVFQWNNDIYCTIETNKIGLSENIDNTAATKRAVGRLDFAEIDEKFKIQNFIQFLCEEDELNKGKITNSCKIVGHSKESKIYVATIKGIQSGITDQDILNEIKKIESKGKGKEEADENEEKEEVKRRKKFENKFFLERICVLGEGNHSYPQTELSVTLNVSNDRDIYFHYFIIVEENRILFSNLFICKEKPKVYLKYIEVKGNNLHYFYEVQNVSEAESTMEGVEMELENDPIERIINGTQFLGEVSCLLNESEKKLGGIYLEKNEYKIKAKNNIVVGKIVALNGIEYAIVTFNGNNSVLPNNIVGKFVPKNGEGSIILGVQNNVIGEFYQFNDNLMLYISDMNNVLAQYLMANATVPEYLNSNVNANEYLNSIVNVNEYLNSNKNVLEYLNNVDLLESLNSVDYEWILNHNELYRLSLKRLIDEFN
ncbi:hypothetical protein H8356DRAFT_1696101 [Neocallimastix lanati (nom. inval.)]|jgi:hypothetical protein|nr:hypothetical protein H8356DRAFT_1696101 [Neocallimastix sp. JGI-2020a]